VYFPQYGWIEFEPTPSQAVITHEGAPAPATEVPTPAPTKDPGAEPSPTEDTSHRGQPLTAPTGNDSSGGFNLPFGPVGGSFLIAGVLAALAAVLFLLPFSPFKRKQAGASAGFYYTRMLFWSKLLRAGPAPHQTPFEYSESLAREVPGTGLYTRTIARAYVRERFGRESLDMSERNSLGHAYAALKARLWKSLPGRQLRRSLGSKRK
jgi:hypothetical protein